VVVETHQAVMFEERTRGVAWPFGKEEARDVAVADGWRRQRSSSRLQISKEKGDDQRLRG